MRLVLKQKDGEAKEYQFTQGPIHIGRAVDCQVFLPDRTVSKKHATIACNGDGCWQRSEERRVGKEGRYRW